MSDDIRFVELTYGPALLGIAPAVCLVALLIYMLVRRRPYVPPVLLLASTCVWYAVGLGATSVIWLALFCGACVAATLMAFDDSFVALGTPATLAAVVVAGVLSLEFTCNVHLYTIGPQFWLIELALVAGLVLASWLLGGRRGAGPVIVLVALELVGLLQHYILSFRGTAILPSDVFALGTALSVSAGYTYGLSNAMLRGFSTLVVGLALTRRLRPEPALPAGPVPAHLRAPRRPARPTRPGLRRAADVALALAIAALTAALVVVPDYKAAFGADLNYWWSKDWYERQGFLPSFILACQDLRIVEPQGYTEEAAEASEQTLAAAYEASPGVSERRDEATGQFASVRPNVVVVQNETFADLSNFEQLKNGYTGPAFWNGGISLLKGEMLMRGELGVSVFGGGTCNTEFEFLTGNSMLALGTSKYPFTMYDLSDVDSLPRQLAACGYRSIGIHPNVASNWSRDRAYTELGFDEFLDIDDFAGAEQFHTHVSDWATYERVLDLMGESDEPLFVFDVTMQNHSGYDTGSIPEERQFDYVVPGLPEGETGQLNEFLACIDESDRAFQRLVTTLSASDEPTIVVMYGDHQPWFSDVLNDTLYPGEDPATHLGRIYKTTYVVWANYDVAGWSAPAAGEKIDTVADLLAAQTLDVVGGPLSTYQEAQLGSLLDANADFSAVAYHNFHG